MRHQRSFQQTQRLFDSPKTVSTITNPIPPAEPQSAESQPTEVTIFDLPVTEPVSISTEATKSIVDSSTTGSIPITKIPIKK